MGRLTVAQPEAVEVLIDKLRVRGKDNPAWHRVMRAADRAHRKYREVSAPDFRGFYHGLLTGYAVAIKALQGKVTAAGTRP
jgi:hypothetical protein